MNPSEAAAVFAALWLVWLLAAAAYVTDRIENKR